MKRTLIRNWPGAACALLAVAAICVATLTPTPGTPSTSFWCIVCGDRGVLDFAANVVMFVPLGFALMLATGRRWSSVLACVATTFSVELLQVSVVAGRDASLGDLVANTLGGGIGVALATWRAVFLFPGAVEARRFAVAWAVIFAAVCGLTSVGLHPSTVPRSLWVQWTPPRRGFEPFTGRLLAFDLNGIDLPLGFPDKTLGVDRVLRGDAWQATATIATEQLQPRRSVIARIAEEFTVLVSLEQSGLGVSCMQKTKAGEFKFRSPKVVLENALQVGNGEAPSIARLQCIREGGTLAAAVDGRRETLRLSPGLGWLLASPLDIGLSRALWWANALWLAALTLPLGYWGAVAWSTDSVKRSRRLLTSLGLGSALVVGLVLAPLATGTSVAAAWEWASVLCGLTLGYVLSSPARRRR